MNELLTNGSEIKQRIISEIEKAKQCIYIAMAYFTDRDIAHAIVDAKNRNIIIDIILSSNAQNETVKLMLKGAGIKVHSFETGDVRGIMHHKFALIDYNISINGSYNYSFNASNNNVENIQVSDDKVTYDQFLSEFERLKYNIDNQISVNESTTIVEPRIQKLQPISIIESFSQQLNNLVYSATQIDLERYKLDGYETSKDSKGSIDIFRAEYNRIKEKIVSHATDQGLGSVKNALTTNISITYEVTKNNIEAEKSHIISIEKNTQELEKRQILDKISAAKQEKSILELGNSAISEKGLLQVNKEIERNKLERRTLDQSFVVKKFWSIPTILILIGLLLFGFYLSLFFASALYKVFFEANFIRESLEAGLNPGLPQLVDANAILKIFRLQGLLFGCIAAFFFLVPVLLSNLKILGSNNKLVNNLLFWVGLLIFDILVSAMVAINTDEIKSLLNGTEAKLKIWEVFRLGEFWLIFVFGMFPLILTHYLISYLSDAYKKSQREIVDADKHRKIQFLDEEIIDLIAFKNVITDKIRDIDVVIDTYNRQIIDLEMEHDRYQTQTENKYFELLNQIKAIFDDFNSRIKSGKIFTDIIFGSVIAAYKSGFIEFLPQFYATDEVTRRVREIEQVTSKVSVI